MAENSLYVFVGTYTVKLAHVDSKSDGIYVYKLDLNSGEMTYASKLAGVVNPSYLAIEPQQHFLYAVSEVMEQDGQPGGAVGAFRIDPETRALTSINSQPSHGTAPCYVWVDQTGKWAFVANYVSGSAAVYPINADGSLGEASATIQHEGSSVNRDRQEGPHAHCMVTDPTNQFVAVVDLGIDKVMIYTFDHATGNLSPAAQPNASLAAGAGPRHLTFHPNGRYAYVINELASTITVFAYEQGRFSEVQTVSTLPSDFDAVSYTSAIHVAPSGRFVYGSNRGHDSIAIFTCDAETGYLTVAGHQSTQGNVPRDFAVDPTGTFLLAANQNSDNIVSYRINQETGALTPTGHEVHVPTPVCLKITE